MIVSVLGRIFFKKCAEIIKLKLLQKKGKNKKGKIDEISTDCCVSTEKWVRGCQTGLVLRVGTRRRRTSPQLEPTASQ